jgi:hypothetical protein
VTKKKMRKVEKIQQELKLENSLPRLRRTGRTAVPFVAAG